MQRLLIDFDSFLYCKRVANRNLNNMIDHFSIIEANKLLDKQIFLFILFYLATIVRSISKYIFFISESRWNKNLAYGRHSPSWRVQIVAHRGKMIIGPWCHAQKMFWMILLSVTKTFPNMLVFKILNGGFLVNHHSKSITEPKL